MALLVTLHRVLFITRNVYRLLVCLSVCLVCHPQSVRVSVILYVCPSISVSVFLFLCLSICRCLCLYICLCPRLCLYLCLSPSISIISLCFGLFVCLCLTVSRSLVPPSMLATLQKKYQWIFYSFLLQEIFFLWQEILKTHWKFSLRFQTFCFFFFGRSWVNCFTFGRTASRSLN